MGGYPITGVCKILSTPRGTTKNDCDPYKASDWNEQEKQKTLSWLVIHRKKIHTIFSFFFFISCILSLWIMISNTTWVNGVFLGINLIFLGIRLMTKSKRSFGLVYDKNKRPVFGVSIQYSFTTTPHIIIKKVVTDQFGRYYILAKNGTYQYIITHNNKIIKKDTIHITNGLFAKDFQV